MLVPTSPDEESRAALGATAGEPIENAKKSVEYSPMRAASVTTSAGWTIQPHDFLFGRNASFLTEMSLIEKYP
ncbi:MAG: hypothetical protein ABSE21_07885 [Bryobacteraceae bacterium]